MDNKKLNIALWIVQILLALLYGMAGFMKSTMPIPELAAMLTWPGVVPEWLVRFVGVSELVGAVGIIVPAATRILPSLTIWAAVGFSIIQILAIPFHGYLGDWAMAWPLNAVLLAMSVFVVWGRSRKLPIAVRGAAA